LQTVNGVDADLQKLCSTSLQTEITRKGIEILCQVPPINNTHASKRHTLLLINGHHLIICHKHIWHHRYCGGEEEHVTIKILKQAESPTCAKTGLCLVLVETG